MRKQIVGALLLALVLLGISSCKPRTSRTRNTRQQTTTQQTNNTQSGGVSAKQVMSRTDSALQRVAALNSDEASGDVPPVASEPGLNGQRSLTGASYVPRPSMGDYEGFQAGLAAFNGGAYDQAIAQFSQVVLSGHPPEMVPNAYYWMGESYYAMQRYAESLPYFDYVTKTGPEYKREMAYYKLSRANLAMGNQQGSNLWYERLRTDYPRSTYVKKLAAMGAK